MNFSFSSIIERVKEFFARMTPKTKRLLALIGCFAVAFSVVVAILLNSKPYGVLYSGMTQQETTEISARLQELGESVRIDGGDTILVLEERLDAILVQMASEGYPKTGLNYDYYTNNVDLMSTDEQNQESMRISLEQRVQATLRSIPGVKDAIVLISPGSDRRYVLQEDANAPTASVVVTMDGASEMAPDLVNSVQVIVAGGYPKLTRENVSVVDAASGREVSDSSGETNMLQLSTLRMRIEEEIETATENKVLNMLSGIYESGTVRVSATAAVDADSKIREMITYMPSENNRGVISSESSAGAMERDPEAAGGVVGTETNAEVPVYPGLTTDGTEIYYTNDSQIDYLVSQVTEQIKSEGGTLTDLRVSVTVEGPAPAANETAEIKNLIANTAGILPENTDLKVALVYYNGAGAEDPVGFGPGAEPVFADLTLEELILVGAGVLIFLIIVILVMSLVGRSQKKRAEERAAFDAPFLTAEAAAAGGVPQEPETFDFNLKDLPNTREKELREQITQFADENPEISAQLIRTLLRGVED